MSKRYLVATAVSIAVFISAFVFAAWVNRTVLGGIQQQFQEAKDPGTLPPGAEEVNLSMADLSDSGVELPESTRRQLGIADLILSMWFLWMPMVLAICFGTAALLPKRKLAAGSPAGL